MSITYPMIRDSVHIKSLKDGVLIKSATAAFTVSGKGLFAFYSKVFELLKGVHSVNEIHELLNEKQIFYFDRLIDQLHKNRMILDAKKEVSLEISDEMYFKYGSTIEYIKERNDLYETTFFDWTKQKIILWGNGSIHNSLSRLLSDAGVGFLKTKESISDDHIFNQLQRDIRLGSALFNIDLPKGAELSSVFSKEIKHYLIMDDSNSTASYEETLKLFKKYECEPIVILIKNNIGFIGPSSSEGASSLEDFFERFRPAMIERGAFDFPSNTFRAAFSTRAFIEILNEFLEPEKNNFKDRVVLMEPNLNTRYCPIFSVLENDVSRPLDHSGIPHVTTIKNESDVFENVYHKTELLFHELTGLFERVRSSDLTQIPFYHVETDVHFPKHLKCDPHRVIQWGYNYKDATVKSIFSACAHYADTLQGLKGLVSHKKNIAAADYQQWKILALAAPLMHVLWDRTNPEERDEYFVNLEKCADLDIFQLVKTLMVYLGYSPVIKVRQLSNLDLFHVELLAGSGRVGAATCFGLKAALIESLGALVSSIQTKTFNSSHEGSHEADISGQIGSGLRIIKYSEVVDKNINENTLSIAASSLANFNLQINETMFSSESSFSAAGISVGFIEITER